MEIKEPGNFTMECPADGYPLNVTWMRVNEDGQETSLDSKCIRTRKKFSVDQFYSILLAKVGQNEGIGEKN